MLPPWATADDSEDAVDDERLRRMTPEARLDELAEILVLMDSILDGRPDREAELARRDALPDGWLALVNESRRARKAG
jgi:hypothetical protein